MSEIKTRLREVLGDGPRSGDFEEFVSFAADMRRQYADLSSPETRRLSRFIELFSIAAIEGGREASAAEGDSPEALVEIVHAMCAGASVALCSAVLSILRDDTPASALRSIVMGSFRKGLDETIRVNGLK